MYIMAVGSIHTAAIKLTLAIAGFVITAMGISVPLYYKNFTKGAEQFEAKAVKMKRPSSGLRPSPCIDDQVIPIVEYTLAGKLIKASHFLPVFKNKLDFIVGDTITIIVNPRHPTTFMIKDYDIELMRKNNKIILFIGMAFDAAAAAAFIFF